MIEDVTDTKHGEHQHIDHIYFTRLLGDASSPSGEISDQPDSTTIWLWATLIDLQNETAFETPSGDHRPPPEDVLKLGAAAIRHVSEL